MFEMRSDLARKAAYDKAGKDALSEGKISEPGQSIFDQLDAAKAKSGKKKKKRFPWITVLSLVSCVPFLIPMGGGSGGAGQVDAMLKKMDQHKQEIDQGIQQNETLNRAVRGDATY